jgi:Mce-associated membrane protein
MAATEDAGEYLEPAHESRRGLVRALAVLAGLFFAGTVAMAVLAATLSAQLDDERGEGDERREVQQIAGQFAARLLTYDFRNLEASKKAVLELSTGKFRREYEQAFKSGLQEAFAATQARSTATVSDVFAGPIDAGTATVIVVVEATAEGTAGTRRAAASYIQLTVVKVAGAWRIDDVVNLNFGQSTSSPQTPATTPTTAAPAG